LDFGLVSYIETKIKNPKSKKIVVSSILGKGGDIQI